MVYLPDIGNINHRQVFKECYSWTIGNLLSLLHTTNIQIVSPVFYFENLQCALGLKTYEEGDSNEEWIGMSFWCLPKKYDIHVKLGTLSADGEELSYEPQHINSEDFLIPLCAWPQFVRRSEVTRFLHAGQLTVSCEMQKKHSEQEIAFHDENTFDGILAA